MLRTYHVITRCLTIKKDKAFNKWFEGSKIVDAQTRAFYLSIKNPITRQEAEKLHKELAEQGKHLSGQQMRRELMKRGYDGVIFRDLY